MLPGAVCDHVGSQGAPVCVVAHGTADPVLSEIMEDLSGWQLLCGGRDHAVINIRLTDLDRFFAEDPALQELRMTLQEGHMATRSAAGLPWVVVLMPAEDEAS